MSPETFWFQKLQIKILNNNDRIFAYICWIGVIHYEWQQWGWEFHDCTIILFASPVLILHESFLPPTTHTHTLTHSLTHSHTHSHTHTQTHTHTHSHTQHKHKADCVCSVLLLTGTEVCYLVEMQHISHIYYYWVWSGQSVFVTDRWTMEYADYQEQNKFIWDSCEAWVERANGPPSEASFVRFNWGHRLTIFRGWGKLWWTSHNRESAQFLEHQRY